MSAEGWGRWYDADRAAAAADRAVNGNGTAEDARILADLFEHAARRGPDDARAREAAEERAAVLDGEMNEVAARLADYLQGRQLILTDLPLTIRRKISSYKAQSDRKTLGHYVPARDEYGSLPDVPEIEREQGRRVVVIDG